MNDPLLGAHQLKGEQTNTSLVLPNLVMAGAPNGVITKVLRYPAPVPHPDVEVPEALHRVGYFGVPRVLGFTTAEIPSEGLVTTSITSELIPDAADGFELACDYARQNKSFTAQAKQLGATIAELHNALAQAFPISTMVDYDAFIDKLQSRAQEAINAVPALAKFTDKITHRYTQLRLRDSALCGHSSLPQNDECGAPRQQRIHGDMHLGQTLYCNASNANDVILRPRPAGTASSQKGKWFVLDFEGEPLRPAGERSAPDFPERDVAGMVRSFAYAQAVGAQNDDLGWAEEAAASFINGYQKHRPIDPELLNALVLDKALYEAIYEHRHRPAWLPIPIAAITQILGENPVS